MLDGVEKALGMTPNLMKTLAHSPAALDGYLKFGAALGGGTLSAAVREQIAIAVAGANSCGYCASAHTALGKKFGVDDAELNRNLRGESRDAKLQAALEFSRSVVEKRGFVDDREVEALRAAGCDDGEIVEIIANIAHNIFTNYFNHIAQTKIDFPEVSVPEPAFA